ECSEERLEERRKTKPLDILAETIAVAEIDHLLVLGSAWLCFKIAQRVHARVGGSRMKPFVMPSAVVCSNDSSVHLFLVEIPMDHLITDETELATEKRRVSEEAVATHSHCFWLLATDGGVGIPTSVGVGMLLSSLHSSRIMAKLGFNRGKRPCSRRTESRAPLLALERLIIPRI
ncbi:RNaseH, partial [Trypanosoma cruzi]